MPFIAFVAVLALAALTSAQPIQAPAASSQKSNQAAEKERSGYDPLLDLPPLAQGRVSLVGGTVAKIDPIAERLELHDFGGGKTDIRFDVRTQVLRNGAPAAVKDIRPGQRVYVDTMLNGDQVFAKSIRLETGADQGDARGQVVTIDPARGILELHEEIAREPFRFRLSKETTVLIDGRRAAPANVLPGALVTIVFVGGATSGVAREIHVLANPGQHFTFAGKITFLDLRLKRFAILNRSDGQTYDIALSQLGTGQSRGLRVGSEAIVKAVFNGKNYEAQNIEMSTSGNNQARQ